MKIGDLIQSGDWKGEKHVPVIYIPETVNMGEEFEIKVSIGEEIKHPNELEHHIAWIKVFFKANNSKLLVEISNYHCSAHGESGVKSEPIINSKIKLDKPGTIYALAYCNIHGLWENSVDIEVK